MKMFLEALGRPCAVINLDFANDHAPYKAAIDVRDLITLEVWTFLIRSSSFLAYSVPLIPHQ